MVGCEGFERMLCPTWIACSFFLPGPVRHFVMLPALVLAFSGSFFNLQPEREQFKMNLIMPLPYVKPCKGFPMPAG